MKVGLLMPNTEYDEFLSEISGESNNNSNTNKSIYYSKTKVNKFVFSFLAIFFGVFGIHWFYAKQYSKGLWYLLFSWTSVPMFLGWYQGIKALLTQTDSSYLIEV